MNIVAIITPDNKLTIPTSIPNTPSILINNTNLLLNQNTTSLIISPPPSTNLFKVSDTNLIKGEKGDTGEAPPTTDIQSFICDEDLLPYQPVGLLDNGKIGVVKTSDLSSWGRYIGINLNTAVRDSSTDVRIVGVIKDLSWNWDITQEIYISDDGFMTQSPSPSATYMEEIATVLTPTLILLTRTDSVLL